MFRTSRARLYNFGRTHLSRDLPPSAERPIDVTKCRVRSYIKYISIKLTYGPHGRHHGVDHGVLAVDGPVEVGLPPAAIAGVERDLGVDEVPHGPAVVPGVIIGELQYVVVVLARHVPGRPPVEVQLPRGREVVLPHPVGYLLVVHRISLARLVRVALEELLGKELARREDVGGVQPEVRRGLPHDVEEGEEGREGGVHRGHSRGQVTVGRGERGRGEESAVTDGRPAEERPRRRGGDFAPRGRLVPHDARRPDRKEH